MQLVAQACYPNPRNIPVKVFRGWPIPAQLDADLAAGVVNVSVYPSDAESKTTRHLPQWVDLPVPGLYGTPEEAEALLKNASGTPAS